MNTPLFNKIKTYYNKKPLVFHMPGHKLGKGLPNEFIEYMEKIDVTEIDGTDNLHYPKEAILEAEELAAKANKAYKTYFLVNGSTAGIYSTILATCGKGIKIIVDRCCHKSVYSAILMSGADSEYLYPAYNDDYDIYVGISESKVIKKLENNPGAVIILTRPNYFGVCYDLKKIIEAAHANHSIVIIDEAHGAHFIYNEKLPQTAMELGADIAVQSTHKTLPALTQTAMVHVSNAGRQQVNINKLDYYLSTLMTSSPSYILMCSIDIARDIMVNKGEKELNRLYECIKKQESKCKNLKNIKFIRGTDLNCDYDFTRLVFNVSDFCYNGYEVEDILREKYNIIAEMADTYNIVFISTISDDNNDIIRLFAAIIELDRIYGANKKEKDIENFKEREMLYLIRESIQDSHTVLDKEWESVDLENVNSRICAQLVTPYPPGIPILAPGEIWNEHIKHYVKMILANGGIVNGIVKKENILTCICIKD